MLTPNTWGPYWPWILAFAAFFIIEYLLPLLLLRFHVVLVSVKMLVGYGGGIAALVGQYPSLGPYWQFPLKFAGALILISSVLDLPLLFSAAAGKARRLVPTIKVAIYAIASLHACVKADAPQAIRYVLMVMAVIYGAILALVVIITCLYFLAKVVRGIASLFARPARSSTKHSPLPASSSATTGLVSPDLPEITPDLAAAIARAAIGDLAVGQFMDHVAFPLLGIHDNSPTAALLQALAGAIILTPLLDPNRNRSRMAASPYPRRLRPPSGNMPQSHD